MLFSYFTPGIFWFRFNWFLIFRIKRLFCKLNQSMIEHARSLQHHKFSSFIPDSMTFSISWNVSYRGCVSWCVLYHGLPVSLHPQSMLIMQSEILHYHGELRVGIASMPLLSRAYRYCQKRTLVLSYTCCHASACAPIVAYDSSQDATPAYDRWRSPRDVTLYN